MVAATCHSRGSRDHRSWVTRSLDCTSPSPQFSLSSAHAGGNSRRSHCHERILASAGSTPRSFSKTHPLRTVVHGVQTKTQVHLFVRRHQCTSPPTPLIPFAKLGKNIPLSRPRSFCFKNRLKTRLLPLGAMPRAAKYISIFKSATKFSNATAPVSAFITYHTTGRS